MAENEKANLEPTYATKEGPKNKEESIEARTASQLNELAEEVGGKYKLGTPKGGRIDLNQGPGEASTQAANEEYKYEAKLDTRILKEPNIKPGSNLTGSAATARMEQGASNEEIKAQARNFAERLANTNDGTLQSGFNVTGKRKVDAPKGFGEG